MMQAAAHLRVHCNCVAVPHPATTTSTCVTISKLFVVSRCDTQEVQRQAGRDVPSCIRLPLLFRFGMKIDEAAHMHCKAATL